MATGRTRLGRCGAEVVIPSPQTSDHRRSVKPSGVIVTRRYKHEPSVIITMRVERFPSYEFTTCKTAFLVRRVSTRVRVAFEWVANEFKNIIMFLFTYFYFYFTWKYNTFGLLGVANIFVEEGLIKYYLQNTLIDMTGIEFSWKLHDYSTSKIH